MNDDASLKKSPLKFYILVFALSVPFWLFGAIAESLSERLPVNLPVSSLMAVCPLIAALILVNKEDKFGGIKKLLKKVIDPIQDRWSALQTSLVMGAVWGIWHVVPYIQAHHNLSWIVWQCFFTIAARVLIVWLYNNTGKSVLSAIIFHTMINVSYSLFPNYGSHYNPAVVGVITAIIATIVVFLWGSKTLARYRYA